MAVSSVRSFFGRFFDTAFGYGVGGAASAAIEPIIEPAAQRAWETAVAAGLGRALNPADLAAMAVQGVLDESDAAAEAAKSGVTPDRFHLLFRVNGDPIAPVQALDLWNRGDITEDDVNRALLQSRIKPEWVETFKLLRRQLVQLADLAEMVVQDVLPHDDARSRAAMLGIAGDDFDRLVRLAGNPPGPETLLEMWNRGHIDEARATLGLRQSRLKPEWVEAFKLQRIRPASAAAAVSAVVKERIPMARGVEIAAENGIDEPTFRMLVDEAGRPISITEGLQLLRRDKFTHDQFREVVARSDVKTEYSDNLLDLQEALPSLAQMRAIIGTGALPDDVARVTLKHLGLSDAIVGGVIAAGHGDKLAGAKQLTQSAIIDEYQAQQLDAATAAQLLGGLGYDTHDAQMLLGYADYARAKTYRAAVIAVVKARFLQRDIDSNTASGLLDQIGMPAPERDQYLALWQFDLDANPRLLTLAELNALVKKDLFTEQQYRDYLPRLGYVEPEISLLVELHVSG